MKAAIHFLFILAAGLALAQQPVSRPVTDLVIHASDSSGDVVLHWSRPAAADSFRIFSGDSALFSWGVATQIGATADTEFIHLGGLLGAEQRFYAVTAITSMVVVPAGSYDMGAIYQTSSQPVHSVNVPEFRMDIYEVTNSQYKDFCDATSRPYPPDPGFSGIPDYFANEAYLSFPVVMVDWNDARDYAAWAGKRLPTEAEWERAAKGHEENRQWPWGDVWVAGNANIYDNSADEYPFTCPVTAYPAGISPVGCFNMTGNVWEWCEDDWHESYAGAPDDGSAWIDSPRSALRCVRGGSWGNFFCASPRCASRGRFDPASRSPNIGFRCCGTLDVAVGLPAPDMLHREP